ncbi:hypothetical protein [Nocardia sp. NPDC051570]|uniref:hypothetical protein n=1 Tax=Nocardia sp. NPDC051570 TaxID=3364324 RepID=UPI0037B87253
MGRHSAQPSLGFTLRVLMISAAALLTASIAADHGSSSGRFSAIPIPDSDASGELGGQWGGWQTTPGPVAPEPTLAEADTPTHSPSPSRGGSVLDAHSEPPAPSGPLDALMAAWVAGTARGFDLLKGVEEALFSHLPGMPDPDRPAT